MILKVDHCSIWHLSAAVSLPTIHMPSSDEEFSHSAATCAASASSSSSFVKLKNFRRQMKGRKNDEFYCRLHSPD